MLFTSEKEAEEYCRNNLLFDYLQQNGINTRRPFRCLNPAHIHEKNTPSMSAASKYGKQFCRCFGDCNTTFSIFDIAGFLNGISDFREQKKYVFNYFNIEVDKQTQTTSLQAKKKETVAPAPEPKEEPTAEELEELPDQMEQFYKWNEAKGNTIYWKLRGINEETQNRLLLGYDELIKRVVIPVTTNYCVKRATEEKQQPKLLADKGTRPLYNPLDAFVQGNKPIIVVEGEIDAISIIQAGGLAIGLGGIGKIGAFVEEASKAQNELPIIIALDNDDAGTKAAHELEQLLDKKGIKSCIVDLYGKNKETGKALKDANEALLYDADALAKAIRKAEAIATTSEVDKLAATYAIDEFEEYVEEKHTAKFSTGLYALDAALNGGLYEGIYSLGAICGLGKTTLALQIADNVAKAGKPVLIFSLEQNLDTLRAKSISRLTFMQDFTNPKDALDAREILTGKFEAGSEKGRRYKKALDQYKQYASNIYVVYDKKKRITPDRIKEEVAKFEREKGEEPLIIVDYLQILDNANKNLSDKQKVDEAINELLPLADAHTIILISSFNRDNYDEEVSTSCYKESGNIEYSSTVLIGLQYDYMRRKYDIKQKKDKKTNGYFEVPMTAQEREARIRLAKEVAEITTKDGGKVEIDFVILKDKLGTNSKTVLEFYPKYNCYLEWKDASDQTVFVNKKKTTREELRAELEEMN